MKREHREQLSGLRAQVTIQSYSQKSVLSVSPFSQYVYNLSKLHFVIVDDRQDLEVSNFRLIS